MNVAAAKSHRHSLLQGMVLTGLLQALPTFAGAAMLLKLVGSSQVVGHAGGAAIFVAIASLFHAVLVPWLAPKFPRFFRNSYEPLFFDDSLSFSDRILQWRTQPMSSLQLLSSVVMLSLLAVAVLSVG